VSAADFIPAGAGLPELAAAVQQCRGCELHEGATQAVFGEGDPTSPMVLVGEQPGDVEDRQGRPFVGPAGRILDRALERVGVPRERVWITNAVKHFRFRQEPGKPRRLHVTPDLPHLTACRPWLTAELDRIRPLVVVALGATAAKALLPPSWRVTRDRGQVLPGPPGSGAVIVGTTHPSAILRTPDEQREEAFEALVADLQVAVDEVRRRRAAQGAG
jgi:uracil-DNA glycosylase family protein